MTDLLALIGLAPNDAVRLAFLATVFFAVCLAVYGVSALWSSGNTVRRRMGLDAAASQNPKARTESLSYLDEATRVSPVISPIVRRLVPTDMAKISLR